MTEMILGTGSASNPTQPASAPLSTRDTELIVFDFEPGADPSSTIITVQNQVQGLRRILGFLFFDSNGNSVATTGTTITNNGTTGVIINLPASISAVKAILVFGR
jgi:hypothetical protein